MMPAPRINASEDVVIAKLDAGRRAAEQQERESREVELLKALPGDVQAWIREVIAPFPAATQCRIREELLDHYRNTVDQHLRAGLARPEAERAALQALGPAKAARNLYCRACLTTSDLEILRALRLLHPSGGPMGPFQAMRALLAAGICAGGLYLMLMLWLYEIRTLSASAMASLAAFDPGVLMANLGTIMADPLDWILRSPYWSADIDYVLSFPLTVSILAPLLLNALLPPLLGAITAPISGRITARSLSGALAIAHLALLLPWGAVVVLAAIANNMATVNLAIALYFLLDSDSIIHENMRLYRKLSTNPGLPAT